MRQRPSGKDRLRSVAGKLRWLRRLLAVAAILGLAWGGGLFWFASQLPTEVQDLESQTDAIVVLTGGSDRLNTALALLTAQKADKLFVSGVYRGIDVRQLLEVFEQSPEDLSCCVFLGYEADNTRGNAIETADWIAAEGAASLRLVTATYHMPRSLLEFRRRMPGIEVVPHPVFPEPFKRDDWWLWPGSSSLLVSEYSKYLVAVVRNWFESLVAAVP
ncbi:YdcF family protein [Pelagibius litoralis]|uniref:YdcF family protein n=1 Tax=Pelagibius litoralis TaxID=374515 RepID=A0A967EVB1_9PROT|nr:YdcF family protein [Pelagibius litoralis]NIA68421.1 YdcF family protein [Pelagibius litoralis]